MGGVMIQTVAKAMKAKWGDQASHRVYKNEAEKECVEFRVTIPRGDKKHPKTAGVIMNCACLPEDCCSRVMAQLERTLSKQ